MSQQFLYIYLFIFLLLAWKHLKAHDHQDINQSNGHSWQTLDNDVEGLVNVWEDKKSLFWENFTYFAYFQM